MIVTVVESGREGRELDAGRVEICAGGVSVGGGGKARGRDVWGVWIGPGRVDAGARTLRHGGMVWRSGALVRTRMETAVRGCRARHAAGVVVDLGGIGPSEGTHRAEGEAGSDIDVSEGSRRTRREDRETYKRRGWKVSGPASDGLDSCLEGGQDG